MSNGDGREQLQADLADNRQGRLSARQLDEWRRGVAYRRKGLFGRIAHGNDALARDVEAGQVASIDGAISKRRLGTTTDVPWMAATVRGSKYQLHVENQQGEVKRFRAAPALWDASPGGGNVRLYYLPQSHEAVNVELVPASPVEDARPTGAAGAVAELDGAPHRHDRIGVGEAARLTSMVEFAFPADVPASPSGGPLDRRPLAEEIVGRWTSLILSANFRSDGTLSVRSGVSPEQTGRWFIQPDGRLHAELPGLSGDAAASVHGDHLTLVLDGQSLQLDRAAD